MSSQYSSPKEIQKNEKGIRYSYFVVTAKVMKEYSLFQLIRNTRGLKKVNLLSDTGQSCLL